MATFDKGFFVLIVNPKVNQLEQAIIKLMIVENSASEKISDFLPSKSP